VPGTAVVGFLLNPNVVTTEFQLKEIQAAARVMGQQIEIFNASSEREINLAFDAMARSRIGALLVSADPFFQVWRPQLIDLAQRHRIPAMYEWAEFVTSGGLASYSTNRAEAYRLAGLLWRAFSMVRSRQTCPCSRPQRSNWSSTSRPSRWEKRGRGGSEMSR